MRLLAAWLRLGQRLANMASERCWGDRCKKAVCGSPRHPKPVSSTKRQPSPNEASEGAYTASNAVVPRRGQGWEVLNLCAECEGDLRAGDGHFHSRRIWGGSGSSEPICCKCLPDGKCNVLPLVNRLPKDVMLSGQTKKRGGKHREE